MTDPGAEMREEAGEERHTTPPATVPSRAWRVTGTVLVVAGSLALTALVAREWRHPGVPIDFTEYRVGILELVRPGPPALEFLESDLTALNEAFAARGAPAAVTLPEGLGRFRPAGGLVLEWQGRPVSLVQYLPGGREVLLLVIDRTGFVGQPSATAAAVALSGDRATATWQDAANLYLLSTPGAIANLQTFL